MRGLRSNETVGVASGYSELVTNLIEPVLAAVLLQRGHVRVCRIDWQLRDVLDGAANREQRRGPLSRNTPSLIAFIRAV